jgi:DNA-directed RNA polymerase specialized sigma24 family protein
MSRSAAIAEEVRKMGLRRFWERSTDDPARGPLELWLMGITGNKVLKRLNAIGRHRELSGMSSPVSLEAGAGRRQEQAAVRTAIAELPDAFHEAVVLTVRRLARQSLSAGRRELPAA